MLLLVYQLQADVFPCRAGQPATHSHMGSSMTYSVVPSVVTSKESHFEAVMVHHQTIKSTISEMEGLCIMMII